MSTFEPVATWEQFKDRAYVELTDTARAKHTAPPSTATFDQERRTVIMKTFFALTRPERTAVMDDALANAGLVDRYGNDITEEAIGEYCDEERSASETDAFINLAASAL